MNLKNISDSDLLDKTKEVVTKEKFYTHLVLEHLSEVDKRKLYCDLGLPSLFSYCVQTLNYSEAEASVRVNAVRLIQAIPVAKEKIENGNLSLSNASLLQRESKNQNLNLEQTKDLLKIIEDKSNREAKKLIQEMTNTKPKTLNITLPERLIKKLELIQKDMDNITELQTLEALMDQYIENKNQQKQNRQSNKPSINQRYITRKAKEAVNVNANGQCQFVSPITKTRCPARTHLQYDHVSPISEGGNSQANNLQKLCPNHNKRRWIKNLKIK